MIVSILHEYCEQNIFELAAKMTIVQINHDLNSNLKPSMQLDIQKKFFETGLVIHFEAYNDFRVFGQNLRRQ